VAAISRIDEEATAHHAPRRHLSSRQAEVVDRLVNATVDEVQDSAYEGLTVRGVARRAGVAPATAYTYFSSKDHLLAEVLWRRFQGLATSVPDPDATPLARVSAVLGALGRFMTDDPALATAGTTALLGAGPDVKAVRDRLGADIHRRLSAALGKHPDPTVLWTLELAYTGAMLSAGMGHLSFDDVPARLTDAARLVLEGAQ
jgi:AcrR family transcriptional regulator